MFGVHFNSPSFGGVAKIHRIFDGMVLLFILNETISFINKKSRLKNPLYLISF